MSDNNNNNNNHYNQNNSTNHNTTTTTATTNNKTSPLKKQDRQDSHDSGVSPTQPFSASPSIPVATKKATSENKRRRVTRACDTCRSKKVKCDGRQPCIHCTVYSFRCTYDEPNIRNKRTTAIPKPAEPNVAALQVAAQAAAATGTRNYSLNGVPIDSLPTKNLVIAQQIIGTLLPKLQINLFDQNVKFDLDRFQKATQYTELKQSLISSGLNEIADLMQDPNANIPLALAPTQAHPKRLSISLQSDDSAVPPSPCEIKLDLPSKERTLELIFTTWTKACVLFRFYHRPSLLEEIDLLYSLDPSQYGDRQQKFLPFLYSSLACGSLFSKTPYTQSTANDSLEDDGFKYFLEARKLIDISNVGDTNSIQTIIMMIIYLQCSARLSTCYSYIGIALRSALKEGLHRNLSVFQNSKRKLDPIEVDTRKRMFYTIYKMDIYINSLLGLPRSLAEDEFDQEIPVDLDDENITRTGYDFEKQNGRLSSAGCANHHTRLMFIMSHIIKKLYPVKVVHSAESSGSDDIHQNVTELEMELKVWLNNLPQELQPTDPNSNKIDVPKRFVLANCYLQLAFLNCQIMLYRPFIHYISDSRSGNASDPRSLIRGRNCIKIARMVVKLANKMIDEKLLIGTYWFSMYTIFFSIACLVYYYHFTSSRSNNGLGANYAGVLFDDDLNIDIVRKDIEIGKKVLDCLKNSSNSSLRIYNILNTLFEQLNRKTASRSLVRKPINEQLPVANEAILQEQAEKLQSSNVQATFQNFDNNNQYYQSNKRDDLGQLFKNHNLARFHAHSEIPQEVTNIAKMGPGKDEENQEVGGNSGAALGSNYIPGVFDKLDAQIFGKILPPYMAEKNEMLNNIHQMHNRQPGEIQGQMHGQSGEQDHVQQQGQQQQKLKEEQNYFPNEQYTGDGMSHQNFNQSTGVPAYQPQPQAQNQSTEPNSNDINSGISDDILDFDEIIAQLNGVDGYADGTNSIDYLAPF